MILKPRMILQPKTVDSETKTDDSETKNDSETKKKILKPRMIPKPTTTGNQGSSKNVICKTLLSPPHPTPPSGDDAMLSVAARVPKEGTQLPERYCPPHPIPPPPRLETMPCRV